MNGYAFEDRLELFGLLGGAFVVIVGLGTLIGAPWSAAESGGAGLLRTLGVLLTLLVGIVTIVVTYAGDITELLPGDDAEAAE